MKRTSFVKRSLSLLLAFAVTLTPQIVKADEVTENVETTEITAEVKEEVTEEVTEEVAEETTEEVITEVIEEKEEVSEIRVDGNIKEWDGVFDENAKAITITNDYVAATSFAKAKDGTLYVADSRYNCIYVLGEKGELTLCCGVKGEAGYKNGKGKKALFNNITSICAYKKGIAIADTDNNVIRYFNGKKVKTLAGSLKGGYKDGKAKKAKFLAPTGIVARKKVLYVTDRDNNAIRVIKNKNVSTITLKANNKKLKKLKEPMAITLLDNELLVADSGKNRIVTINEKGKVKLLCGDKKGKEGDLNGKAKKSRFSSPSGLAVANGKLYIADTGNSHIKVMNLSKNKVKLYLEGYSFNNLLSTARPRGLMADEENGLLYIGDLLTLEVLLAKVK